MGPSHWQVLAEPEGLSERGGDREGASTLPISPPSITSLLQTVSINKAINAQEVAVKEKHARNILLKAGHGTRSVGAGLGLPGKGAASRGCMRRGAQGAGEAGSDLGVLLTTLDIFPAWHGVPAPAVTAFECW